jgi:CHASE3 domain sensor protein
VKTEPPPQRGLRKNPMTSGKLGMKLTIFSRLIIGYLIIFILVMAVSAYAALKLHQFNVGNRHILSIDNRILNHKKKLLDSIMSQQRYENEYILSKDIILYEQFLSAKNEFDKYLMEVLSIADTPPKKDSLNRVKSYSEHFQSLIKEESKLVGENQSYDKKWYE